MPLSPLNSPAFEFLNNSFTGIILSITGSIFSGKSGSVFSGKEQKSIIEVYSNDSSQEKLKKLAEDQLKLKTGGTAIVDSVIKVH